LYGGGVDVRPPDPPLSDGVVTLRPWTLEDVSAIARCCNEPEIARWMHEIPSPYDEQNAREYVLVTEQRWRDGTGAFFGVIDAATNEPFGSIGMHVLDAQFRNVEVGYWAAAQARGRGLTTRALRLISRWAIDQVGAERVQLRADVLNTPSLRVAEKAGFTREGTLRSAAFNQRQNRRIDYAVYSLLPGE
jgi:RimJ/RimL family protein N-acetyltransferase